MEGEGVLYFAAQWQQDGGGVYDVTKLTHPEVCLSQLYVQHSLHEELSIVFGLFPEMLLYQHLHAALCHTCTCYTLPCWMEGVLHYKPAARKCVSRWGTCLHR